MVLKLHVPSMDAQVLKLRSRTRSQRRPMKMTFAAAGARFWGCGPWSALCRSLTKEEGFRVVRF